jgi:hypothetical protein
MCPGDASFAAGVGGLKCESEKSRRCRRPIEGQRSTHLQDSLGEGHIGWEVERGGGAGWHEVSCLLSTEGLI